MNVAAFMHDDGMHTTIVTVEVPVQHRFAVGDTVVRDEVKVPGPIPDEEQVSTWEILEVGCSRPRIVSGVPTWDGAWYRMRPVNEIAKLMTLEAHSRVARAPTPLVELMGPVTEYVRTVDRQCEHV